MRGFALFSKLANKSSVALLISVGFAAKGFLVEDTRLGLESVAKASEKGFFISDSTPIFTSVVTGALSLAKGSNSCVAMGLVAVVLLKKILKNHNQQTKIAE